MFVLGKTQTDFGRHLAREGKDLADLTGELVDGALADAQVEPRDIGTIHVGNAFGELFAGQGHLGAMIATVRPAFAGVPAVRHEAACASGSAAVLGAFAELAAGFYDVALVLGVEQQRNVPSELCAKHLATAAWAGHEGDPLERAKYLWPASFARIADVYRERFGLDRTHLAAIADKNFGNARDNAKAQTRAWTIDRSILDAAEDDPRNPVIEGSMRRYDCAQVTDGGAAIVLASPRFAEAWAARRERDLARVPRVLGWSHRTVGLTLEPKLAASATGGLVFPHVAQVVADARRRAGRPAERISGYEVHDCFTMSEYVAIDHLGLTPPGQSWRAIENDQTRRGGKTPINASGGLIGIGHPVGATGVRMVADAARQVADEAGAAQIAGATAIQTLNLGGSAATVVSFVVGV